VSILVLVTFEMLNEESSCCVCEYISFSDLKQAAFYTNNILPNILL